MRKKNTVYRSEGPSIPLVSIIILLLFLIIPLIGPSAAERGGVTGAEFLNIPPTSRYNSMGGVIDGLGSDLEGIHYNPAVLSTLPGLGLQINVNPYPNDVSHDQASFGLPIFGGVGAASLQLFNTGGFTYINEDLQPEDTVSVYDAAATVGYSRYVLKNLSAGASVKTIYRTLGDYNALAVGSDLGGAFWFETPHFGRRPKPPKDKKLKKEFLSEKKRLDTERENRIQQATRRVEELKKRISDLEKENSDISVKISEAEGEKKAALIEKQAANDEQVGSLRELLKKEEEESRKSLSKIEKWYTEALHEARGLRNKKVSDLKSVETERARLFSIIDDPKRGLTEDIIDNYIDETIGKIKTFLEDRTATLAEANRVYEQRRRKRIEEIRDEIESYQKQIDTEFGPEIKKLQDEVDKLKAEKQSLETAGGDVDKSKLQVLQKRISTKEKELQAVLNDQWLKKLEERIEDKRNSSAEIEADIDGKTAETGKAIEEIAREVQNDIENFNVLRVWLKRELKKAKLKRELDLLKAVRDKKKQKAHTEYKEKEKSLYLRLLSVMYKHEEKILDTRLTALKEDYNNRRYDLETEFQKEVERLEDNLSFQQRYLSNKISELEKSMIKSEETDESISRQIDSLKVDLSEKEKTFNTEIAELKVKEKKIFTEERELFENKITELKWERKLTRLTFLQTDTPYLNTSVNLAIQNFGTKVKFEEEGYPLPTTFHIGAGYAILNTDYHAVKIGVQAQFPFHNVISVGIGAEYGFLDTLFLRTGYTFGSLNRSFSAGMGARVTMGFTRYAVDYTFQPIPEYGIVHSFGISAYF